MTNPLKVNYERANSLPQNGDCLIRTIIRFEFALKEWGFLLVRQNGSVAPDWKRFANDLGKGFFNSIKSEVPTLISKPPKVQIDDGGHLGWKECEPPTNPQMLFDAVLRVRNNLLHGGKSGDPDHDRNEQLISEAISVLDAALANHDDIRLSFEGNY